MPGGSFFDEFRRDIHVCDPFPIPSHWHIYFAMDYGLDMFAGLWIARDPEGHAYAYKEVYVPDLIISEATKEYKRINGKDKTKARYAPPDLWSRQKDTGKSASDIFAQKKVPLVRSRNNRIDGWLATKEWLQVVEERNVQTGELMKTCDLKIFSNCVNLIRCLPAVQRDEKDPNDVATQPHELTHIVDALRYWCIMWTRPSKEPAKALPMHDRNVARVIAQKKKKSKQLV